MSSAARRVAAAPTASMTRSARRSRASSAASPYAPRAPAAGAAGEERIHGHATTGPLRTRTARGGHHRPGELVPHDERRDAVGHPSEVALDLRAADPRRLWLDDDRIDAEARLVDLLDRHAPRTAPDERAHETAG